MRFLYMAILDWSPNPADISACISIINLFFYQPPSICIPSITMPIDLSNLSAEDISAATAAMEAARRAREERERQEAEECQKQQEEEHARQEATARREAEERKEAAARKAEAEWRDRLAREKAAWEAVVVEEQWQLLAMGLSGLKRTIPAPASIMCMASGSSTQSKGKRKATEEEPSTSQYISFFIFHASLILSVGCGFPRAIRAQSPASLV
jgi:hypothetical protein